MKRIASMVFITILIVCYGVIGYAESNEPTPYASELIRSFTVNLSINGSTATATATVNAKGTYDKVGISSLRIQEKRDGSWVTVATLSNQYGTNVRYFQDELTYGSAKNGVQYRATATFFVEEGTSTETRSSYSATKTA